MPPKLHPLIEAVRQTCEAAATAEQNFEAYGESTRRAQRCQEANKARDEALLAASNRLDDLETTIGKIIDITESSESTAASSITEDADVLAAVTKMLESRIPKMGGDGLHRLKDECSDEDRRRLASQVQHQQGTPERWAWHAGYVAAMNDTLHMIKSGEREYPIKDAT